MNSQYTKSAHRRAVFQQLQRYLMEAFVDGETRAPKQIQSEEVLVKDRVVPQDVVMEVLDIIQQLESVEARELMSYELKKREPIKVPAEEKKAE